MFDTSLPHNYRYETEKLEIHILGGLRVAKLDSLRITLSIQKQNHENIIRHSLDLYNDNQVEKFTRTVAERLEIGTNHPKRSAIAHERTRKPPLFIAGKRSCGPCTILQRADRDRGTGGHQVFEIKKPTDQNERTHRKIRGHRGAYQPIVDVPDLYQPKDG